MSEENKRVYDIGDSAKIFEEVSKVENPYKMEFAIGPDNKRIETDFYVCLVKEIIRRRENNPKAEDDLFGRDTTRRIIIANKDRLEEIISAGIEHDIQDIENSDFDQETKASKKLTLEELRENLPLLLTTHSTENNHVDCSALLRKVDFQHVQLPKDLLKRIQAPQPNLDNKQIRDIKDIMFLENIQQLLFKYKPFNESASSELKLDPSLNPNKLEITSIQNAITLSRQISEALIKNKDGILERFIQENNLGETEEIRQIQSFRTTSGQEDIEKYREFYALWMVESSIARQLIQSNAKNDFSLSQMKFFIFRDNPSVLKTLEEVRNGALKTHYNLTPAQLEVIERYTYRYDSRMNALARPQAYYEDTRIHPQYIASLTKMMLDTFVFHYTINDNLQDIPIFLSRDENERNFSTSVAIETRSATSTGATNAGKFANNYDNQHLLTMPHVKAFILMPYSAFPQEEEIILQHGTQFKIKYKNKIHLKLFDEKKILSAVNVLEQTRYNHDPINMAREGLLLAEGGRITKDQLKELFNALSLKELCELQNELESNYFSRKELIKPIISDHYQFLTNTTSAFQEHVKYFEKSGAFEAIKKEDFEKFLLSSEIKWLIDNSPEDVLYKYQQIINDIERNPSVGDSKVQTESEYKLPGNILRAQLEKALQTQEDNRVMCKLKNDASFSKLIKS